jgi:hypothetical protein
MLTRIAVFECHYPWIDVDGLAYFRTRIGQGGHDGEEALALEQTWARTREQLRHDRVRRPGLPFGVNVALHHTHSDAHDELISLALNGGDERIERANTRLSRRTQRHTAPTCPDPAGVEGLQRLPGRAGCGLPAAPAPCAPPTSAATAVRRTRCEADRADPVWAALADHHLVRDLVDEAAGPRTDLAYTY